MNIKQPTLVVSGNHDVIVYTVNSLYLVQNMPNAKLILGHRPPPFETAFSVAYS